MLLEHFRLHFTQTVLLLALYSFMGWIIEVIYRSVSQRRFVNAGFLYGPFTPIYGIGAALLILISLFVNSLSLPLQIISFAVITTLLEYIIGYSVEKIFGFKLWDYSGNAFNFKGIICPAYTVIWTALALIFIYFIHPLSYTLVEKISAGDLIIISSLILIYFAFDLAFSLIALTNLKKKFVVFFNQYSELSNTEINRILKSFSRFFRAFPDLNLYLERNLRNELKGKINEMILSMNGRLKKIRMKPAEDSEFVEIFSEISSNSEYQRLKFFFHHNSSIYEHIVDVAYLSFKVSKYLKLDYRSTTRGALLHDFFCYDWRNHDLPELARDKRHGVEHPKIALANSEKHFLLNDIERDIIVKHMWPITISPPKYKESFIVSFADKFISSKEYSSRFKIFAVGKLKEIKRPRIKKKKKKEKP